jgi:amino-acid N-acetyltransferase
MLIEQAKNQGESIAALLSAAKLPAIDPQDTLDNFLVATENGQLIGVAGLEIYGAFGLLRSLAVLPEYRNNGVAGKLIERLQSVATLKGLKELYLFTETAQAYFAGKAFIQITRDEVPDEVKQSAEFSHVCPVSAIVMKKILN